MALRNAGIPLSPDSILRGSFKRAVKGLDFEDTMLCMPGRKPPKSLGKFALIPIMARHPQPDGLLGGGYAIKMPWTTITTYGDRQPPVPFLDTQLGIGLTNQDWLVAMAGAGIEKVEGHLKIVQIQDVSGVRKDTVAEPKDFYRTGLHDGIDWRGTLVNAWEKVASATGATSTVILQSGANNQWENINNLRDHPGYDGVARRMGYTQQHDCDWIKQLA